MNISSASELVGIPPKTIRYYEDIGLITSHRSENGYRVYDERDLHMLNFLGRARSLGFTIESCRSLLALYQDPSRASGEVKKVARLHMEEIDCKIEELQAMRDTLSTLMDNCSGDDRPDCPILEALSAPLKQKN
ncbi:HTH-type transcriptional regulator HmrR [Rhodobiaceae bacterium]|nr:HTH-type transcriptional regulator HmrR [Rhodobiaceae bacterium]